MFCVERRKAWRMLQSKAGIENNEYKAQRAILADVDAGKISREDFFARAEELLKARLDDAAEAAPRPAAHPAPAVAAKAAAAAAPAKAPAAVSETTTKTNGSETPRPAKPEPPIAAIVTAAVAETVSASRESGTPELIVAMATQVTIERESETGGAEWDRGVQLRLMELDVDPGNDAEDRLGKRAEN
jgi:hypothetical protein